MSDKDADRKRVLGIVGSPRRSGNTEILVDEVLRGAQEAGASVEKVILSKLDIAPCLACGGCERKSQCVQEDDMPTLLGKMRRSQVWVFGTPIYYWGPTAQFKAFMDRWYGAGGAVTFKGRRIVLTVPLGDANPAVARHTVGMFTDALNYVGAELFATIVAPGVFDRGKVREHPDVLMAAYHAGQEAIQNNRKSQ
jgi:multimeric flavodoxin WrbA